MLQIVLIRPGTTDFDEQGRIQGTLDIPLNEQGRQQVERMVGELTPLGLDTIYCSESQPAVQTAETLAEALEAKLKKLTNMQNLDQGLWQGMLIEEVRLKQPTVYRQWQEQPDCVCPPEGEMLSAARNRVHAAMSKLIKKHRSGAIGLVVPQPLASLVRCFFGCGELGNLWRAGAEGENWEVIEVGEKIAATSR
jgi:broad specificity phosphatase PhoE